MATPRTQAPRGARRICVLTPTNGADDARVMREARALSELGWEVVVVGSDPAALSVHEKVSDGIRIMLVPGRRRALRRLTGAARAAAWLGAGAALALASLSLMLETSSAVLLVGLGAIAAASVAAAAVAIGLSRSETGPAKPQSAPTGPAQKGGPLAAATFPARWLGSVAIELAVASEVARAQASQAFDALGPPDGIYAHELEGLRAGLELAKRAGGRLIFDAHELYHETTGANLFTRTYGRSLVRAAARRIDGFVTVSERIAKVYASLAPGLPTATLVRNAPISRAPDAYDGCLHAAVGASRSDLIALYQGRLLEGRGLREVIDAGRLLPAPWRLVIMGDGPLLEELRSRAEGDPRIAFLPPQPQSELLRWTQGATVGLIPYRPVSLNNRLAAPNKLWEYVAADVPVLATDLPELGGLVRLWGVGCVLPECWEPPDLVAGLRAFEDENVRTAARSAGQRFLAEEGWQRQAERLTSLVSRIVGSDQTG